MYSDQQNHCNINWLVWPISWEPVSQCCYKTVLLHSFHFHVFKLLKSYYCFLSILSLVLLDLILSGGFILFLRDIFHLISIWSCGHYYKVQGWTHGKHMPDTCLPHVVTNWLSNHSIFDLIGLFYLILDQSNVWHYVWYYKIQEHMRYTRLTHVQYMYHCALRHSTVDTHI